MTIFFFARIISKLLIFVPSQTKYILANGWLLITSEKFNPSKVLLYVTIRWSHLVTDPSGENKTMERTEEFLQWNGRRVCWNLMKYNNKHNMLTLYKRWKSGTKSKKSRTIEKHNNRKILNHPPSSAKIWTIYVDFLYETILRVICRISVW